MVPMFRFAAGAIAAAGVLCATLPAAQASPAGGACFRVNDIQNSKMAGPRTLYVRADGGRTYRIGFAADCNTAAAYSLILHQVNNDTDPICSPVELNVRVRHTGEFCEPSSISRLTPEEAAALPPQVRP